MKKMFTLVVGLVAFSALFAQYEKPYDNRRNDDRNYQQNDNRGNNNDHGWNNDRQPGNDNKSDWNRNDPRMNNGGPDYRPDHAVDMHRDDNRWQSNNRMNDGDRRAEMDRINHDYDRRIDVYRNDRRMNNWERSREIDRLQRERNSRLQSFGGGTILGGILGIIIGSHL